jgi:N-carbamoylputrescine amidase
MSDPVRIGLVQMRCGEDAEANVAKAARMTEEAADAGASVVCLPELFRTQYFCKTEDHDVFRLAETIPGPTTALFEEIARRREIAVILSLFEKRAEGLYHNTIAVVDRERGFVGRYRKMHIPDDPLFYEKFYFTPGDLGFRTFSTGGINIGTLICWDQWYPEAARLTAMRGADVLFYPTAIGWLPSEKAERGASQHDAWEVMQRSHAVANGCYVVAVNRIGFEPLDENGDGEAGIEFWGQSFIAGPDGAVLVRASQNEECVLTADVDRARINAIRTEWPFLRDRRIDAYGDLTRRYID